MISNLSIVLFLFASFLSFSSAQELGHWDFNVGQNVDLSTGKTEFSRGERMELPGTGIKMQVSSKADFANLYGAGHSGASMRSGIALDKSYFNTATGS